MLAILTSPLKTSMFSPEILLDSKRIGQQHDQIIGPSRESTINANVDLIKDT